MADQCNILTKGFSCMGRFADKRKEDGGTTIGTFNMIGDMLVPFWRDLIRGKEYTVDISGKTYRWKCNGIVTGGDDEWNTNQWGLGSEEYCCHICTQPRSQYIDFTMGGGCLRTIGMYSINSMIMLVPYSIYFITVLHVITNSNIL